MGKHSRNKGARGEREAARILAQIFGVAEIPRRRLSQYQDSGEPDFRIRDRGDCWAIEVKRRAVLTCGVIDAYWLEAIGQARDFEVPMLLYRADRQPWLIRIPLGWVADITLESNENWVDLSIEGMQAMLGTGPEFTGES